MTDPERGPSGAHDRKGLLKKLKELLAQIFSKKKRAEIEAERKVKEGEKHHEKKLGYETKEEWEKEEERREKKDEERAYHKAKSAEIKEVKAQVARAKRADEIIDKLNRLIDEPEKRPSHSDYLIEAIGKDVHVQRALAEFISDNSVAAELVNTLLTKGAELHGDARELIKQAQRLSHEADGKTGRIGALKPVFEAISGRAQDLVVKELDVLEKQARRERGHGPTAAEFLEQDPGIILTEEEKRDLREAVPREDGRTDWEATKENWREKIKSVVETPREKKPISAEVASEIASLETPADEQVVKEMMAPIDRIWGEVARKASAEKLSIEDLEGFYREIREEEAQIFPKDVPPKSEAYNAAVQELNRQTEDKLKALSQMLEKRLREETPPVKEGINDPKEFLKQMVYRKGRLGDLFRVNPQMHNLFVGLDDKSRKFRDQVFLKIHSAVLADQRNSSRDNFGLYERSDFTSFIDVLREGLNRLKVKETRRELGHAWSDYYNNLSNAIRQCRDLDYWATQPAASIENFNKSLGMFQNEYLAQAIKIPAVEAAFRAYETTLRSVWHSNDGYIPPGFVEYSSPEGSFWDIQSQAMLEQFVSMGTVPDVQRDEYTGFEVIDKDGHTVVMDFDKPLKSDELSSDEKSMYMTLAKGLGLASQRFLEIFANTRVPGSDQPERWLEGFHSMPYEGVARALNYFSTFIHKWRIGSYKYFYLFNQLVPDEKRINDSTQAVKAFMAYQRQDGTFEKEFGPKAKRFVDLTNFSGISSAIGKDTTWRQWDSTIGWSDKQKEFLGGPTQLILSGRYAPEKVKDLLVVDKYREEYRQLLIEQNKSLPDEKKLSTKGGGFDKLWKEYGESKFKPQIDRDWDRLLGKHPKKGFQHTPLRHQTEHLIGAYKNAFKARVWVEMAMRNPLVVAHSLEVDTPLVAVEGKKKMRLHNLLVQDILGIPPEDTKFGEVFGKAGYAATPTERQKQYMIEVIRLEGDIAAVREMAINQGRDLTEKDFIKAIGRAESWSGVRDDLKPRVKQALEYWKKVRQVILGTDDLSEAKRLYDKFGLKLLDNDQDYEWNNHKIHGIEGILNDLDKSFNKRDKITGKLIEGKATTIKSQDGKEIPIPFLLKEAIEMKPEWILGTDDMAFGKMDWENLGARQWLRRGGDVAAHWNGGQKVTEYLTHLKPTPDKHKLAEALVELRNAYSEDMIEIGWNVGINLAYMTDRLFSFDYKRLGSAAQLDVWKTRRNVAAWMANGRREFWDALEHADVFPPHQHFYFYDHIGDIGEGNVDIHTMRKMCHADNTDVWMEIITLGILIALAMTLWRAFTAPSEEETAGGGGGGGGGGGHH